MNALVIETRAGKTTATRQHLLTADDIERAAGGPIELVAQLTSVSVHCAADPFALGIEAHETAAELDRWLRLDDADRAPLHSPLVVLGAPDWEPETGTTLTDCPSWLFQRFAL